jgi:hypothetical protein
MIAICLVENVNGNNHFHPILTIFINVWKFSCFCNYNGIFCNWNNIMSKWLVFGLVF